MSEQETSHNNYFIALNIFRFEYHERILETCDDEEIKNICEYILKIFKKKNIDIREPKVTAVRFCKLNCFFSSDSTE